MSIPSADLDNRLADLRDLLAAIGKIESGTLPSATLSPSDPAFAVMKASALIVLYNLVESTIRVAFSWLYEQIEMTSHPVKALTDEIRHVWTRQRFLGGIDLYSASAKVFHDRVDLLLTAVASDGAQRLDAADLQIAGNIDAEVVRSLFKRHGIALAVPEAAKGGSDLLLIKQRRNSLAHGDTTFSECGRDYALSDLERISLTTEHYLRGIIASVELYAATKSFAAPSAPRASRRRSRA